MSKTKNSIRQLIEEIVELRNVNSHLDIVKNDLTEGLALLEKMGKQVDKESEDVKNLENTSLKSLFSKVLGNNEEQLEKERQEYLEILLKFNEKEKEIELIEYEKELLEKKTSPLDGLEGRLEQLKKIREKEILSSHSAIANELLVLVKKQDELSYLNKEIFEAFKAGDQLISVLNRIIDHLAKARDWGQWDMMGKGHRAGYAKRSAIDRANSYVRDAHRLIQFYKKELRDVGIKIKIDLQFENFNSFIDFFFDNLISDWIVQKKIKNTLNQVVGTREQVVNTNKALENELDKIKSESEDLELKRHNILETH